MYKPLTEAEKDYMYGIGFVQRWIDINAEQAEKEPNPAKRELLKNAIKQVKENFDIVKAAVSGYREKYMAAQEEFDKLNDLYVKLTGLSAGYLHTMQQQKEQVDQLLIEQQREFHQKDNLIET